MHVGHNNNTDIHENVGLWSTNVTLSRLQYQLYATVSVCGSFTAA